LIEARDAGEAWLTRSFIGLTGLGAKLPISNGSAACTFSQAGTLSVIATSLTGPALLHRGQINLRAAVCRCSVQLWRAAHILEDDAYVGAILMTGPSTAGEAHAQRSTISGASAGEIGEDTAALIRTRF